MRKLRESIFLKLLLVFALAGAANLVVMRGLQRGFLFNDARRIHRDENLAEYTRLLIPELDEPPTNERLRELARKFHLGLRVEGPGFSVASDPSVPEIAAVDAKISGRPRVSGPGLRLGRYGDYVATIRETGPRRYLFLTEGVAALEEHSELVLAVTGLVLLILLGTYLSIRRILRPLRSLERGVKELSFGNLSVSIPRESRDELGRLVESFNRMTEQVRTMIRIREQLLLDVSHEFRSPLTRMKVALELPGDDARESIVRSIRELETMITELLESARLDDAKGRLRREPVRLPRLLDELVDKYANEKPGVRWAEAPAASPSEVSIDLPRIRIALSNVLENAIKYSSHQDRPVEVALSWPNERTARISVRDFGVGIRQEEQALIFEPFYRTDRSRIKATGGYGLGLSLCQKIVNAHQGRIIVESTPGSETLFSIDLPAS